MNETLLQILVVWAASAGTASFGMLLRVSFKVERMEQRMDNGKEKHEEFAERLARHSERLDKHDLQIQRGH
jgi:hypothetical protein